RQVELAQRAVARGLSVRALEEQVRRALRPAAGSERKRRSVDAELQLLVRRRAGTLGKRVDVRGSRKKGRLEIHYRNEDELQQVLTWLDLLDAKSKEN
ncbi:MAG: chromosome partitioning protein ParB, partial [Candidatus Desulforudis sp.]|nr:chromosome partitioning protein ParB [Desulforudis sp.]